MGLSDWGYEGSGCCQFCQEPDTLAHRLLRCGYEPAVRVRGSISEGLLGRWQAAVKLDPASEVGLALATLGPRPFDALALAELGVTQSEHVFGYQYIGRGATCGAVCSFTLSRALSMPWRITTSGCPPNASEARRRRS